MTNFLTELAERRERTMVAKLAQEAPRKPWDKFILEDFQPVPGEHIAIIGPTGLGKTVLQNNVLPKFPFVVVFATKPQDNSLDGLIQRRGFVKINHWMRLSPIDSPRRVLWPDARSINADEYQREVFKDALAKIFREAGRPKNDPTGWAVAVDEFWYVAKFLNLEREFKVFLQQGRSLGHSLILATQRPKEVTTAIYNQSTHLFFFRDNDKINQDRLGEIQARDASLVRYAVGNLEPYQVLYVNTRTGNLVRTRTPVPSKG